ncbi:uracil-DNA glycosylase family protein [Altererythrobacter sp.]|uniref:uracil-DNA glycosylase family protein n=1 Tax=Altererythrobacter sp. TaxID=1872480 RepID=UPI003D060633
MPNMEIGAMTNLADLADAELLTAVRRCESCPDLPLGPRPILQWDPAASILIAGQAPGNRTHHKGIPFDDPSGDRLRDWLGVDRKTFYDPQNFAIVPMAFCFPGTGKGGDLPPPARCAELWREALLDRLRNLRLTIVLGQYAAAWHGDGTRQSVTESVAMWRQTLPALVVLPHPSPRNRRWLTQNPWFERELLGRVRSRVREILVQG